nr:cuticle protein AM1199-like [Procambarus clarkii]
MVRLLQVVLACLAAMAAAAPQLQDPPPVAILRDDRQHSSDGNFNYAFEAENGIVAQASGTPGSQGQTNVQGVYSFPFPDGTVAEVRYIADDFGYRVESDILPTPHPLPAHALEQIAFAEEQRAKGVTFE